MRKNTLGFGFNPDETEHHFYMVITPDEVEVYERFYWEDGEQVKDLQDKNLILKMEKGKFNKVKSTLKKYMNEEMVKRGDKKGDLKDGAFPIERLLGKEIMVLLWGIEEINTSLIDAAVKSWAGFSNMDLWWIFTRTNAANGYYKNRMGWRKSIKYMLTEDPNGLAEVY